MAPAKQKLLRAAVELIGEIGWQAISTRMLAERAGITSGLVHYHFPSLRAALREATVSTLREALRPIPAMLAEASTVDAGIESLVGQFEAYSGTDPVSLVVTESYLAAARDDELRRDLAEIVAEFRNVLAAWLADHGYRNARDTASVLAATIDGVLLHRVLNPELTSEAVLPVVRAMLTPAGRQSHTKGKH